MKIADFGLGRVLENCEHYRMDENVCNFIRYEPLGCSLIFLLTMVFADSGLENYSLCYVGWKGG